ncbi:MAG: DJ-1/PfpI family protein [Fusobacterium sp. JB021]|nr:DJ-1/PfpI family protein [Fusobacterium sp. JB020]MDP0493824.1 DJ-1/PfpI family protein [Fusobacterium sp. JB021]MDP0506496.1 DJ-1/PfpI family protein [Fusobacterium sp. JB019]MDP0506547.1 DJ-1/PfpI family protein [Fusobacterium sp. JB019]
MKKIIYVYILNAMADWELGYVMSAVSMEINDEYCIKTVACNKNTITTLGGFKIIPDCSVEEIDESNMKALLIPGGDTWGNPEHEEILSRVRGYLEKGILVGAICGATLSLANLGILNEYLHTSNSKEYLKLFSKKYTGEELYKDKLAVRDRNLVTGSSAGSLLWAKEILQYLNVFSNEIIEAWYNYYLTGDPKYYLEMLALSNN